MNCIQKGIASFAMLATIGSNIYAGEKLAILKNNGTEKAILSDQCLIVDDTPVLFIDFKGKGAEQKMILSLHNRRGGEARTLITNANFENLVVTEEFANLFRVGKWADKKYVPENLPSQLVQKAFFAGQTYAYEATPLFDEINKGYAIRITSQSDQDIHNLISYLKFCQEKITSPYRNVLLLDRPLSILSADEKAFLSMFFVLDNSAETATFFAASQAQMDDLKLSSKGEEYKTLQETLYHDTLKFFKDFKLKKIGAKVAPEIVKYIIAIALFECAKSQYRDSKITQKFLQKVETIFVSMGLQSKLVGK